MTAPTGKRTRKTEAQRAEEAVDLAWRRLVKARTTANNATAAHADALADVATAEAIWEHAKTSPALAAAEPEDKPS